MEQGATSSDCIPPDYLTWREFKGEVLALMPQDRQRIGLMDIEPDDGRGYIPKLIIQAVLDLQDMAPVPAANPYRKRHETLYFPQDFVDEGHAGVGTLPPQSDIQEAWLWQIDRANRFRVERFDWDKRFRLVNQKHRHSVSPLDMGLSSGNEIVDLTNDSAQAEETLNRILKRQLRPQMAIDPQAHTFYIWPQIRDGWLLSIFWNGRKCDWRDDELVPFSDEEAWAVSAFCRAKIAMEVDRESKRHDDIMRDYILKRTNLYIARKEAARLK